MVHIVGMTVGFLFIIAGGMLLYAQPLDAPVPVSHLPASINSPTPPPVALPSITPSPESRESSERIKKLFTIEKVPHTKGIAFTHDGKELWVTLLLNSKTGVRVFRAETGEKIADIALGEGGGVELLFSRDGSRAYVSQMETARVFEIDTVSKKVLRSFNTKSSWTKVLALSPDGATLYASNWLGNDISEIDIASGTLKRKIGTVKTPRGLFSSSDGKYLYVAGFENGDIQKINLATLEKKTIFATGGAMRHFAADEAGGVLFVSDMGKNTIWKVSLADGTVTKFADTDNNPNTIALSPDKKILFVSNRGKNFSADNYYKPGPEWGTVLLFNAKTGEKLDVIIGGNQPTALDVSSDSTHLAFSDFLDERIQVYSLASVNELLNPSLENLRNYKSKLQK